MPSWDREAISLAPRECPCEDGSSLRQSARLDVRRGLGLGELLNTVCEVEYYVQAVRAGVEVSRSLALSSSLIWRDMQPKDSGSVTLFCLLHHSVGKRTLEKERMLEKGVRTVRGCM